MRKLERQCRVHHVPLRQDMNGITYCRECRFTHPRELHTREYTVLLAHVDTSDELQTAE